ncbi:MULTISPECIES: LysE family translocator [unclassified Sedimentibacter]|uniref:LysE family translocator n=1 Tax=unclassified Sedimentibacter TaxID=2649220 RepID=UPI0027E01F1D|nr:LysE family transporter [Sedimentibacter sp. MB35-C1]WMJ77706.1 LysE family transporter [Sedimentibacter sp. MB35-C1]
MIMIIKGLKFGMLLQFAVGPMCLMVFNTSALYGVFYSLYLVFAITLIDALYIALSCVGVAAVINREKVNAVVKMVGCSVLVLFGANTIASAFDLSLLPNIRLFSSASSGNLFIQGLLLTASNPLTIVFWSSMFSTQMMENKWNKKQLFLFAVGCIMATIIFLTVIAVMGSMLSSFLPSAVVRILNVTVGIFLIFFGIRLLRKKRKDEVAL